MQLFGESEGKEGKGLLPLSLTYTTDLHSIDVYKRQLFGNSELDKAEQRIEELEQEVKRQQHLSEKKKAEIRKDCLLYTSQQLIHT